MHIIPTVRMILQFSHYAREILQILCKHIFEFVTRSVLGTPAPLASPLNRGPHKAFSLMIAREILQISCKHIFEFVTRSVLGTPAPLASPLNRGPHKANYFLLAN